MLPMRKTGVAFVLFVGPIILNATFILAAPITTDPPNGGTVNGPSHTFYWANGHGAHPPVSACSWRLKIGTAMNADNIHSGGTLPPSTNAEYVDGLPANGTTLYSTPSYQKVCPGGPFSDGTSTKFTSAP